MNKGKKNNMPVILALLAVMLVIAGFVGFQFFKEWANLREIDAGNTAGTAQLDKINSQNDDLKGALEESNTDAFVIRMAHEVLGWVFKGEIKIVDKDK
jgi:hypothetical protein